MILLKDSLWASSGRHSSRGSIEVIPRLVISSLVFCQRISIVSNVNSQSSLLRVSYL